MSASVQILNALLENQNNAQEVILDNQRDMLARIIFHAIDQTEAYADRLAPIIEDDALNLDAWQAIPVLTRPEIQQQTERYFAKEVPKFAGKTEEAATSGSTGLAFTHRRSALQQATSVAQSARGKLWQGADFSKTQASIGAIHVKDAPYPEGGIRKGWGPADSAGISASLSVATETVQQIEWLERIQPNYLMVYPSVLNEIALNTRQSNWAAKLEIIFAYGMQLSETTRENVRRHIGENVHIGNFYGSEEVGLIAVSCPTSDEMHCLVESVHVEIVDDDGIQVPEGEMGHVVVTSLLNYAMPLIRYDVGDMAIAGRSRGKCGSPFPTMSKVLGRNRNMFIRPDGSKFNPHIPLSEFDMHLPNRQAQVLQHSPSKIEVVYVPISSDQSENRRQFQQSASRYLRQDVEVLFTPMDKINTGPNGKFEDYKCMI